MKIWIKAKKWLHRSQVSGYLGSAFQEGECRFSCGLTIFWCCLLKYGDYLRISLVCVLHFLIKMFLKIEQYHDEYSHACPRCMVCKSFFRAYTGSRIAGQMQSLCSKMVPDDLPKWLHQCITRPSSVRLILSKSHLHQHFMSDSLHCSQGQKPYLVVV